MLSKCLAIFVSVLVAIFGVLLSPLIKIDPELYTKQLSDMPADLRTWHDSGFKVEVNGFDMFVKVVDPAATSGSDQECNKCLKPEEKEHLILVHGFPTSSYDYQRALRHLTSDPKFCNRCLSIVMFDHLGFGFSDKPTENFTYSLMDHADNALSLWRHLGIKRAHIVAHDMGDSVVTEIITRKMKRQLPDYFDDFLQTVTFTNGGMRLQLANLRLSQIVMTTPYLKEAFSNLRYLLPESASDWFTRRQLKSIWSPDLDVNSVSQRERDIADMDHLNKYKGGHWLLSKTISYLDDRRRFETRWYAALRQLDIPCMLLWGDSDAVAPMAIPHFLAAKVIPPKVFTGKVIKGAGHFLMMERPREWAKTVLDFVSSKKKTKQ